MILAIVFAEIYRYLRASGRSATQICLIKFDPIVGAQFIAPYSRSAWRRCLCIAGVYQYLVFLFPTLYMEGK